MSVSQQWTIRGCTGWIHKLRCAIFNFFLPLPGWWTGANCGWWGGIMGSRRRRHSRRAKVGFCFVLNLVFLSRYMQPEGPWQRPCRCPCGQQRAFLYNLFSYLGQAWAVIVRCPHLLPCDPAKAGCGELMRNTSYLLFLLLLRVPIQLPPPGMWFSRRHTGAPHSPPSQSADYMDRGVGG